MGTRVVLVTTERVRMEVQSIPNLILTALKQKLMAVLGTREEIVLHPVPVVIVQALVALVAVVVLVPVALQTILVTMEITEEKATREARRQAPIQKPIVVSVTAVIATVETIAIILVNQEHRHRAVTTVLLAILQTKTIIAIVKIIVELKVQATVTAKII